MRNAIVGPPVEAEGRTFETTITNAGEFCAMLDGECISNKTLDGLQTKLSMLLRRAVVRIAIPVTRLVEGSHTRPQLVNGVLTGLHRANGNPLFKSDGGATEQLTYYGSSGVLERLTPEQHEEFFKLHAELGAASLAMRDFKHAHERNPKTLIKEAWGEKATKED